MLAAMPAAVSENTRENSSEPSREPQMQRAARSQEDCLKAVGKAEGKPGFGQADSKPERQAEAVTEPPGGTGKAFGPEPSA